MRRVEEVVQQLRSDAASGALAGVCEDLGVDLLVLFGSARRQPQTAADVDLAFSFTTRSGDELSVVNRLGEAYGDVLDLLALDRASVVARFEALARGELLVELKAGAFANRQMAAMGEFYDDQPLRDLALEVLSQ